MFTDEFAVDLARQCATGYYYCGGSCQSVPCYLKDSFSYEIIFAGAAAVLGAAAWSAYRASKGRSNLPLVVRGWLSVGVSVLIGIVFAILGTVMVRLALGRPRWWMEWTAAVILGFAVPYLLLGTVAKTLGVSDSREPPTA